ncbi:nucleotidyltransferase family protein [Microbacterium sp.]|uniref:nucleotidyltransferase family protein n=1 Tax=Microbacterium sp. TaxID=51671 RepID=UPI003A849C61
MTAAVCGIVLAAGAGSRFGGPKALARDQNGTAWVARAVTTLTEAGCADVLVALGADRERATHLVPPTARIVAVTGWREGLAASVRAGLGAAEPDIDAALLVTVDTPDMPAAACARLAERASYRALARAVYGGVPGHPVLIGRHWWTAVAASLRGDRGAGSFLQTHAATAVECGDLWHGADVDTAPA